MKSLEFGRCLFLHPVLYLMISPNILKWNWERQMALLAELTLPCFDCLSQYVSCSALKKYNGYCPTGRIPVTAYVLGSHPLPSRVQFCLWSVGKYCNKLIQSHGWILIMLLVLLWQNASLLEWELWLSGNGV